MHSLRRAAARAACSSTMVVAKPRQQVALFAMNIGKMTARPAVMLPLARNFSQTSRAAQEEGENGASPPVESQSIQERQRAGFTVFVSNVTFDATDVHIQEAFGKYGEISLIHILRDGRGLSRGFGFITYTTQEAADRAVQEANQSFWHGRRIIVAHRKDSNNSERGSMEQRNPSSSPGQPSTSIYIGNIPYETSDADLNKLFESLDGVTDVRVAVDRNTGWPRGFAHADFADIELAKKAYEVLTNATMGGRPLRIDYAQGRRDPTRGGSGSRNPMM